MCVLRVGIGMLPRRSKAQKILKIQSQPEDIQVIEFRMTAMKLTAAETVLSEQAREAELIPFAWWERRQARSFEVRQRQYPQEAEE